MASEDNSPQAFKIHYKTALLGSAFRFPASVSSCIPTLPPPLPSNSSYFSVHEALNGLFQTSRACTYFVHSPGKTAQLTLLDFSKSVRPCLHDKIVAYDCRIRVFVVMYAIKCITSSERTATLGTLRFRDNCKQENIWDHFQH